MNKRHEEMIIEQARTAEKVTPIISPTLRAWTQTIERFDKWMRKGKVYAMITLAKHPANLPPDNED